MHAMGPNVAGVIGLYRNQRADTLEGLRAEAGIVTVAGNARSVVDRMRSWFQGNF